MTTDYGENPLDLRIFYVSGGCQVRLPLFIEMIRKLSSMGY